MVTYKIIKITCESNELTGQPIERVHCSRYNTPLIRCCQSERRVVFDCDAFRFEILIEGLFAQILSESGLLEASERRRHVGFVVRVDEASASVNALRNVHRLVDILNGVERFGIQDDRSTTDTSHRMLRTTTTTTIIRTTR